MKELYDQLGVRVPVYALFTKADLIAGFTEFFDDLDRERRGQVWGVTFPLNKADAGTAGLFGGEFTLLVERLNAAPARPAAGRAQPGTPHADRRLPRPGREPRGAARRVPTEAFGGSRLDPGAAAARRLSDLGHAGRHADRSADRRDGAQLRHRRAARAVAAAGAGPQLFPRPAAEGRDLRRGDAGLARSRRRCGATCSCAPAPAAVRCSSALGAPARWCRRVRRTRPRSTSRRRALAAYDQGGAARCRSIR